MVENPRLAFGIPLFVVQILKRLGAFLPPSATGVRKNRSAIRGLKPQTNGPSCSNTVIGTLAVDGWAVTFGTARRGLGGLGPHPVPSSLYTKCNSPPINGQCANFI